MPLNPRWLGVAFAAKANINWPNVDYYAANCSFRIAERKLLFLT